MFFLLILLWVGFAFGGVLWGGNLFYIAKTALFLYFSAFYGLINFVVKSMSFNDFQTVVFPVLYTLSVVPGILVSGIAYYLGSKGIALFSKPAQNIE